MNLYLRCQKYNLEVYGRLNACSKCGWYVVTDGWELNNRIKESKRCKNGKNRI